MPRDVINPHDKFFRQVLSHRGGRAANRCELPLEQDWPAPVGRWNCTERSKFFGVTSTKIAADFLANYLPQRVAEQLNLDSLHPEPVSQRSLKNNFAIQRVCESSGTLAPLAIPVFWGGNASCRSLSQCHPPKNAALILEPVSYVDEELGDQCSDLLYRIQLTDGGPGFVYVLFEHKSYAEPYVALQLLRYMAAIWDQDLKDQKTGRHDLRRLPVIISLVFYHGAQRWEPRTLRTLLGEVPVDLSGYVPDFHFILSDFSGAGSPKFGGHPLLQALLRVFHAVPAGNLRAELEQIMLLWRGLTDEPLGRRLFRAMLEYIFRADSTVTVDEVVHAARTHISPREGAEAMTIAEELEKRGIQKGQVGLLQRLLESRFGQLPDPYKQRLQQADSGTLLAWSERVLTAETLDDVFGQSRES